MVSGDHLYYGVRQLPANIDGTFNYYDDSINLYKLLHKLKIWLRDVKNVMYDIRYHTNSNPRYVTVMTYGKNSEFFVANTELEAVVEACQRILDNKES